MKNRESFLFSIVLLLLNAAGATGALVTVLKIAGTVLLPGIFFWGMIVLCLLSVFLWSKKPGKKMLLQWTLTGVVFLLILLLFRRELASGVRWALQEVFAQLNQRYGIHLVLGVNREAALFQAGARSVLVQATWSVLAAMTPYVLLLGYGVVRERVLAVLAADGIWFAAACFMNEFPAYFWFALCILGLAAVVIRRAFREDERAGLQAVLIGLGVLVCAMAFIYRFAVPALDSRYEEIVEARVLLNTKINQEWIPKIKSVFAGLVSGEGTDVTGELTRTAATAYTSDEIYRVTFDSRPGGTIYLRGFVGKDYGGDQWKAGGDSALERYYRGKGWELPEGGGELVNLTYEAFRHGGPEQVLVEELATPGSYSLYPYGACMTEDYKVHWDGTAERKGASYSFSYNAPGEYGSGLKGDDVEQERRYREYVYDTFCEYPAEQFPELTDFLENAGFRRDTVYHSLEDVSAFLKENADYNLDVPNTPKGEDFIEYFLFDSREGYCAHFASSAVMILRYLGIPARYAAGYSVPSGDFRKNAEGSYSAVVLDKQAHAWAEIYLDGIGWIPVEMTGSAVVPGGTALDQLAMIQQLTGEDSGLPEKASEPSQSEDTADQEPAQETVAPEQAGMPEEPEKAAPEQADSGQTESDPEGAGQSSEPLSAGSGGQQGTGVGNSGSAGSQAGTGNGGSAGSQAGTGNGGGFTGGQGESGGVGSAGSQAGTGSGGSAGSQAGSGNGGSAGSQAGTGHGSYTGNQTGPGGGLAHVGNGRAAARKLPPQVKAVFQALGLAAVISALCILAWRMVRWWGYMRLQRAGSREKVFLLCRNNRRLLRLLGPAGRLGEQEGDAGELGRLLEKCGFGEKAPTAEELRRARELCGKLAGETYERLPLYRKPLFLCMDLYGQLKRPRRVKRTEA